MAKLQPVIPTSDFKKSLRMVSRAQRARLTGLLSPSYPNFLAKISRIWSRFLCKAGKTICEGSSQSATCKINSARSVSKISISSASETNIGSISTSVVTIDFDLTIFLAFFSRTMRLT